MARNLVDAVVGEARGFDAQTVVGLLLEGVAGQRVDVVAADLLLIAERELAQTVHVVGRGRAGDVRRAQLLAVGGGGIAADAHRAVIEIAVVVPLLAEPGRELEVGEKLVNQIEIEVVARHLLVDVQLVGDRQRVFGEVHAPVRLHADHGAAGVIAVFLVGRQVGQVHQRALDHAVVDHAALGLYDGVLGVVHRVADARRQALGDLGVEVDAGVDAVVVRRCDDTVLIHVTDAGHVLDGLRAADDRYVVAHDAGVGEKLVLPVGVVLRRYGGAGREVVEHRVDAHFGQREAFGGADRVVVVGTPRHAGGRGAQAVGVVAGVDQQVAELRRVQQVHLVVELLDAVREVVADFGGFAVLAALGGDEYDARRTARTVNCGRSGVLQDVDAFDVAGVDEYVLRSGIAVDHVKGSAARRERIDAAHTDGYAVARRTAGLVDFDAGDLTD